MKAPLVDQSTNAPTRKVWAAMIATAATSVARYYLDDKFPALATPEMMFFLESSLMAGILFVVMYYTRDRA